MALGAGLLAAASFLPFRLAPLAIVATCLFLFVIRNKDTQTARNLGLLYGLALGGGASYWFFNIFFTLAIPLIAIFAAYFGVFATLVSLTRGHGALPRAAIVALFGVGVEWLRGDAWYLRYPWYTVPHALAAEPFLIAPVRWLGTYGFSYVIWLVAGWGAFGHVRPWLAFLLLVVGWFLLPPVEEPPNKAVLVQCESFNGPDLVLPRIPADKVDLAVFPEYAYFSAPQKVLGWNDGPAQLARKLSCPVVFGAVEGEYGTRDFLNVAAVVDAEGQLVGTFTKQRPIPLARDGVPGQDRPVFPVDQGTLGVAICYDADAPAVVASLVRSGATVLVIPTFDAMSWGHSQHRHHELLLRLRAVENDRWILRAASSGRTEAINPRGEPSDAAVAIGAIGHVTVGYAHRTSVSLGSYLAFLGPLAAAGSAIVLAIYLIQYVRSRKGPTPPSPPSPDLN
jgi:apolipoprotein N-acyltransferase